MAFFKMKKIDVGQYSVEPGYTEWSASWFEVDSRSQVVDK